ncbi:MAG TPA: glycosyltransferase family A protein [Blastocatellia bacterium]|nr:glycosyltransferase family A protein [Blastocatellia bacterium]
MSQPSFSVIIPTFNRARFLPEALDSVFIQGVADVQVIVVDDGSTDGTEAVIADYGHKHGHKIDYVRQENGGAAAARNTGLSMARGRLISFLDSDDLWVPGKMKAELSVFDNIASADAVISDSERWMENELVCRSWFEEQGLVMPENKPAPLPPMPPLWTRRKPFATCCLTITHTALERLGQPSFDTSLPTHQDWDFVIRMIHSCKVIVLPDSTAIVRRFNDGTRVGRPLPGTPYPPAVKRVMAQRRYRIFEKAQNMKGWPDEVVPHIEQARSEAAREFADNLSGWRRRGLARMVVGELQRGAYRSAAVVMASGLAPAKVRSLFSSSARAKGRTHIATTTERPS